jgi:hypothetical protein
MTEQLFEGARSVAHILLGNIKDKRIDSTEIATVVGKVLKMEDYQTLNQEKLIDVLSADFEIHMGQAQFLVSQDVIPWLADKKTTIAWSLWNRYKMYMRVKDPSFPVNNLDDLSDKILDKCFDPTQSGSWDRRGMVVGHVQSGKTSNYVGLINKAADAGYKLIIVIAGIHNSLRAQTQKRVDEGFIGRKSSDFIQSRKNVVIGVGEYSIENEIYSYTSSAEKGGDFNNAIAQRLSVPIGGKSPTILVIKKNKSILENVLLWLSTKATQESNGFLRVNNVPLLVIDDEADNASVNSGENIDDIRTINRLIRCLLTLFQKSTFIGYTATPYANIFIPEEWNDELTTTIKGTKYKIGEDLFPRDFIVNIPAPSNYIGAAKLFGFENAETGESKEGLPITRTVDDQEPYFPIKLNKSNKENLPDDLPNTLHKAIQSFLLTCAIRRVRGQITKHNSMLIHVALYVKWIDRVAYLVNELMRDYKNQITSKQGPLLGELEELFHNDFANTTYEVERLLDYKDPFIRKTTWIEVMKELEKAVSKIQVRAVHGEKKTGYLEYHGIEEINYENYREGLSVIAVGGNRLSRGITLEGLSVSYYLRTSRMYDSLMQMGRWFGYRPGYVDLCRLFTTDELVRWYRHVIVATEEMRADFDELASNQLRPKDYQLKVRTHPGLLSITSASKMRYHEIIRVGFSGDIKQTYELRKDEPSVTQNLQALENLLKALPNAIEENSRFYWIGNFNAQVTDFLDSYLSDQPVIGNRGVLSDYIRKQVENGKLKEWAVALRFKDSGKNNTWQFAIPGFGEKSLKLITRRDLHIETDSQYYSLSQQNISDPPDRYFDLNLSPESGQKHPKKDLIHTAREQSKRGLLVIYPLDWENTKTNVKKPIIGFFLAFPKVENEMLIEYAARLMNDDFEESQPDDEQEN